MTELGEVRGPIPRHVAIIMDGNGRWARQRSKPRTFGHHEGAGTVRCCVETAARLGVKVLTLYAFSEENWSRPPLEVTTIMELIRNYVVAEQESLHRNNVRLRLIGNTAKIPTATLARLQQAEDLLSNNTGMILVVAVSYGGRQELVRCLQGIALRVERGELQASEITSHTIESHLFTTGLPDPDLLIRTSGEQRISNLLLWQMAYTELYFTTTLWPDFTEGDFIKAIEEFQARKRRFGGSDDDSEVTMPPENRPYSPISQVST